MKPCTVCTRLDGADSSIASHPELSIDHCISISGSNAEGRIESYCCRRCSFELQRFCQTNALDGWLVRFMSRPTSSR